MYMRGLRVEGSHDGSAGRHVAKEGGLDPRHMVIDRRFIYEYEYMYNSSLSGER